MTDRIAFAGPVTAEGRKLRGEVVLLGSRTWRNGEWLEIDPAAVVKADAAGAFASWEHDDSKLLAATSNDTLRLSRTETGFTYETADLPNVSYANDALELVRGGYVTGTSFEIEGLRSSFATDPDGTRVRRITSIKRFRAVNPVRDPAFTNSSVAAFSKESEVTDKIEEPVVAPEPKPEPTVKFTAPKADDVFEDTLQFARNLDTDRVRNAMDALMAEAGGDLKGDLLRQYEAYSAALGEFEKGNADEIERSKRMKLMHEIRLGRTPVAPTSVEVFESDDYKQAWLGKGGYLRTGNPRLIEQFAQSVAGDGSQGGFTVAESLLPNLVKRLKAFGGIASAAFDYPTTNGEAIRAPYLDDTANTAAIASEGAAPASGGADLVFDNIELGAFSYASTGTGNTPLKVSLELLQDTQFPIEDIISQALAERIGRKQATHLATGAGGTEPVGLFTKSSDTMSATAVSLAVPEHVLQVDSRYRDLGNCRWIFSDTTLAKIWQSQTTTNQPLFVPGGATIGGSPQTTLWGFPFTIDPAAGTKVAFGDIRRGYIVRRVRGIQLLVDPYTAQSTRQVAYHAWARMDANIWDPNAYSVSEWSTVSADT